MIPFIYCFPVCVLYGRDEYRELTEMERQELKTLAENKRIEFLKQKGVKEYFYGQNVVYARNQKNANRKAINKGYHLKLSDGK